MRSALAAATLVLAPFAAQPAHATGGSFVATCAMHYNLWGVGTNTGTGNCSIVGVRNDGTPVNGSMTMTFTVRWGSPCPSTATYTGTTSGVARMNFVISRLADDAVITTSGDVNGAGNGAFVLRSPVGNACGGSADETFVFGVSGT